VKMNNYEEDSIIFEDLPASRRQGRELAVKALYALELSGNSVIKVLQDILPRYQSTDEVAQFTRSLIEKTHELRDELDELIKPRSKNWEFDRIALVDKIVLRLAICEFLHFWDVPPKVSMDEAIELSKLYSTQKSRIFINGVLDGVLSDLQKAGQIIKTGRGLRDKGNKKK
jgi:transcription antitermination protein NusB